ncbi:hypothetical protein QYE76_035473 [Lolium multiflorum]|uniref:Uncharacterized protein n=1 Tax=Lolium multiflorum TaxID=4521 RepID=A0AAD8R0I0_LOLMU|nr:hypothetical protein QYE76_035473 [Lolium multiflorum]
MPRWFTPAYIKKTQASKLGDAQGIPFFIDNIISGIGIGGVLMQEGHPIAYFSEKLSGAKLNYPIYDKELYALIRVLEESHAGGLMDHFGREKTLLMLADHFYWPKMRRDVDRVNMEASKRADFVRKIHVKTKELIEKKGKSNAARMNKKRKEMLFKPGDMVWVHFRKDRFPKLRKSKLKPRGAGPYKVLAKINDNAYSIDLLVDEFGVSNSFNVADLTPYDGEDLGASGYQEETSIARGLEEQLYMKTDVKMDVKLDMELDMKISHGREGEREACAREKSAQPVQDPGPIERSRCVIQVIIHFIVVFLRCHHPVIIITTVAY